MSWTGEKSQAIGARSAVIFAAESVWGVVPGSPNWRKMRLLAGESMDQNVTIYESKEMRDDRMHNASVLGSQEPGGNYPFELSPNGWNPFWWNLLGGSVTTTGPVAGAAAPVIASATPSTGGSGNNLAAGTYKYIVTSTNAVGESLGSSESSSAVLSATGKVTVTWSAVTGATGYNVYGRASGTETLLVRLGNVTSYVDNGAYTPDGVTVPPVSDTSGSVYTHVIKGSVSLPTGFTLEKQFNDIGVFIPFYGNRVDKVSLNYGIDKMVDGVWSLMARQAGDPSDTSLNSGAAPTSATDAPFTSAQAQLYEGSSLTLLGTGRQLTVDILNNYDGKKGLIIGDVYRQNLKPGTRRSSISGKFMFDSKSLYQEATQGRNTKFRILANNGVYSVQIDFPKFRFLPSGTTPKATDQANLEIDVRGEGLPETVSGTDVIVTTQSPEASIVT